MKNAFTMIELLLTMGMLSIISLLLISYTGDVGNVSVDAASWKIQADIRHAQQLATSTGINHGVNFVRGGLYTVYKGDIATAVENPLDHTPMREDVSVFGDVSVANAYRVEFDKLGRPVIGGGGDVQIATSSGASRRVYVIDNTGAVIVDVLGYGTGCNCNMCSIKRWP